jgi:ribosomal protein S27AE
MTKHITKEELIEAVRSTSYAIDAAKLLNVRYDTFKRKCIALGVEVVTKRGCPGKPKPPPARLVPLDKILSNDQWMSGQGVKLKLWKEGILKKECSNCGQGPTWFGKPLTLQLDHIDGDKYNNSLSNLRILCPNCHTQTHTWGGKNRTRTS